MRLGVFLLITATVLAVFGQEDVPEVARTLLEEAQHAKETRHIDDAIAKYRRVIEAAPQLASAYIDLGALLHDQGKTVDLDPSFIRAYYNLGAVLFDVGRDAEALDAYKMALAPIDKAFARNEPVDRIHARAYSNLGAIHLRQKQWQSATDACIKAL